MSVYFTIPSFARAKKHTEELQKTNPKTPILKDEDEKFLERQISTDEAAQSIEDAPHTKIRDDGIEEPVSASEQEHAESADKDDVVLPATQPDSPEAVDTAASSKKPKKNKAMELPSQEEAEKATKAWQNYMPGQTSSQSQQEKRTWTSYLPNSLQPGNKSTTEAQSATSEKDAPKEEVASGQDDKRTWAQYASTYVPGPVQSLPALTNSWLPKKFASKDKDANLEPVYNEDGSVNPEETRAKQEREVSVLLDRLDMSSINNRVFALSQETEKVYDRFAQVLRDTLNGVPTAYDDMDKLMREAGPQIEKQFRAMPQFVQTLVKSLPAKLSAVLAPELMAAAKKEPTLDTMQSGGKKTNSKKKKSKRRIPDLRSLLTKEGAIAGMLRSVVSFLRVRFPFLASATNVVMSLAVFILMFVFWYCHKRGKEVRLAKEADAAGEDIEADDDDDDDDEESDDGEDGENEEVEDLIQKKLEAALNQPEPALVPLPNDDKE